MQQIKLCTYREPPKSNSYNTRQKMTDQFAFTYPSPLEGYENEPPLPEETSEDGKSLRNPQTGVLSKAYETFVDPLDKGRRGGL